MLPLVLPLLIALGIGYHVQGEAKDVKRGGRPAAETEGILTVDKARFIDASGEVGGKKFFAIPKQILALTNAPKGAPKEPIYIFLNGPGGNVFPAVLIGGAIELAKKRGYEVKCITAVMAASATFNMLAKCSTRYALPTAVLLFHPVRVYLGGGMFGGPAIMKAVEAKTLADALDRIDQNEIQMLCDTMVDSQEKCEEVKEHYNAETEWSAAELKEFAAPGWIHLVDDIQGIDNLFNLGE